MEAKSLFASKTFWTGAGAILASVGGYLHGDINLVHAIYGAIGGLAVIFNRMGQGVPVTVKKDKTTELLDVMGK